MSRSDTVITTSVVVMCVATAIAIIPMALAGSPDPVIAILSRPPLLMLAVSIPAAIILGLIAGSVIDLLLNPAERQKTWVYLPVPILAIACQIALVVHQRHKIHDGEPHIAHAAQLIRISPGPWYQATWSIRADVDGDVVMCERVPRGTVKIQGVDIHVPDKRLVTMSREQLLAVADALQQEPEVAARFASIAMTGGVKP